MSTLIKLKELDGLISFKIRTRREKGPLMFGGYMMMED